MARAPHKAFACAGMIATVAKVVSTNTGAKLRSWYGTDIFRIRCDIAKPAENQYFIAVPCSVTKRLFGACEKIYNICLSKRG